MSRRPGDAFTSAVLAADVDHYFMAHRAVAHRDSPLQAAGAEDRDRVIAALEEYRKATTNLPRAADNVEATHKALTEAMSAVPGLQEFYNRYCEASEVAVVKPEAAGRAGQFSNSRSRTAVHDANDPWNPRAMEAMHKVAPGIFVGSYHPANDAPLLRRHGITHVCCCINVPPRFPADFTYITLPADDANGYNISQHFEQTFTFIDSALTQGGGVLIHCGAGISRAPTITCAYLIRKLGITAERAIARVREARPCASPNLGFQAQLREYAAKILRSDAAATAKVTN